jgi:signal peptidase
LISKVIAYVAIVVIGIAIMYLGLRIVFGTYNPFYVVASGSMIPTLNISDFVIINHNVAFNNLRIGDIIVFKSPGSLIPDEQHETIVHRVAHISIGTDGIMVIRTKGDANPDSIPNIDYPIREHNYMGKVVYIIPKLGLVTKVISPPTNYIIIGAIIITLIYYARVSKRT